MDMGVPYGMEAVSGPFFPRFIMNIIYLVCLYQLDLWMTS